ncbi:hypothetical protein KFU94_13380 [Chloroflexi bacterium TSY]|nr:hypothetical protein [Chloroflexi bacterium TSY]
MNKIVLKTPARLHFGLLDMNGSLGRIDGGIGLALDRPYTLIEANEAPTVQVKCAQEPAFSERLQTAVEKVCQHYQFPGASVNILERQRPHAGLGSATQTLVGAAMAVCKLYEREKPALELARIVGRGGTSGIGIAAIQSGGFILDGGHQFQRGDNSKQGFSPSSASAGVKPPPVIARYDFPDWDILVVIPLGEGASGHKEQDLFSEACPVSLGDVRQMCHILLMQMLPAVLEKDLETFGQAMEDFQLLGFKRFELQTQPQLIRDCLTFLKEEGGIGVGMSSWGPGVYAFGDNLAHLQQKIDIWLAERSGGETYLTKANNIGMEVVAL